MKDLSRLRDIIQAYQVMKKFFDAYSDGTFSIYFGDVRMAAAKDIIFDKMKELRDEAKEVFDVNLH